MKPDPIDTQLENLRLALAWLNAHRATLLYSMIGMQAKPVINIAQGGVTNKLRAVRKFQAEAMGRVHDLSGESVRWQASLFGCHVEWLEPVSQPLPNVRVREASLPTVLHLLNGGA